jgi:hypothetical protein
VQLIQLLVQTPRLVNKSGSILIFICVHPLCLSLLKIAVTVFVSNVTFFG